jgi:hemerythrin-like metal-binding protein
MVEPGYAPVRVVEIDDDHRVISEMLQSLLDAVREDNWARAEICATALEQKAIAHFAREEGLMEGIGYPALQRHKQAHDQFLAEARARLDELRRRGLTSACLRWVVEVMDWFRLHVLREDMPLARALIAARRIVR